MSSHAGGLNLWWTQNDGMGGHVFLGPPQLVQLGEEMLAQGIPWRDLEPGQMLSVAAIDEALAAASPVPQTLADHALWRDWLDFLEGAAEHGGIIAG